jgi:hypothetical protein
LGAEAIGAATGLVQPACPGALSKIIGAATLLSAPTTSADNRHYVK